MAFGFSPKYITDVPLDNLTPEQFLVLAIEAARKLDWNVGYTSETGFIAYTKFSMSSWSEEIKVKIDDNHANLKSECTGNQMVDWGKNKANIEKLISTFDELKRSFTPEDLSLKYEELKPGLVSKGQDVLSQLPPTTKEKITGIFTIFKPTKGYFITPILIELNIAIFILMVISGVNFMLPDNESLIRWGANFRPITLEGEWWRLITNCFLHIGVFHLLMNMYALLFIGLLLEPHLGKARFVAAYLLTGITASMASLCWNELTISAGASGAIFGMYGVFLAMLTTNLIEKSARKTLLISIAVFVGYNLMNGLKGGIDNAAHIGGLISGIIIGFAYFFGLKKPNDQIFKFASIGILAAIILTVSFIVYINIPNDLAIYDTRMNKFVTTEAMALEVYNLPKSSSKSEILYGLNERGIYYWKENIKLIDDLDKLNLPEIIHDRNDKLKRYCELRIKSYELLSEDIEGDTNKNEDQIKSNDAQIEMIVNEIKGDKSNQ